MIKKLFKIPTEIETYKEGNTPKDLPMDFYNAVYEPVPNEVVEVVSWHRWPAYDFIFGIPAKDSPKHEKEIGFFKFRDSRVDVKMAFYIDITECEALIKGFQQILEESKTNSPHLWKNHTTK